MKCLLTLSLVLGTYLSAQNPPPPPQGPPPNGPEGRPGERSPHRPFAEMLKRHIDGKSPLDKLSEADRKHIREVMGQIWNSDKVKTARDQAAEAAQKYRDALHAAAIEADPSIKPLLEKMIEKMGDIPPPFGGSPGEPRREGPGNFGKLFGIDPGELGKMTDDQRSKLREAFEKISALPALHEARAAMENAKGEGKREANRKMRKVVQEALEKDFPEIARIVNEFRSRRGNGGDEDAPPPPPPSSGAPPPPNTPGAPENAPPK